MRLDLNLSYTGILCTLALCAACTPKDDADPETASESTASSSTGDASASDTGNEPSTGDAPTTGGEPSTGDETGGQTVGDDTAGDDTAGDDTGMAFPAECEEEDPTVSAAFALDLTGWAVDPEAHKFTADCTVESVAIEGAMVRTALTCGLDGVPLLPAILDIAAPPEGPVAWFPGDSVQLLSDVSSDFLEDSHERSVQLRGAGDSLLVSATDSFIDEQVRKRFAPLSVEILRVCGDGEEFSDEPAQLRFELADAPPPIDIISGHRAVLPISEDEVFSIDVEKATTSDIQIEREMRILLRKVNSGT